MIVFFAKREIILCDSRVFFNATPMGQRYSYERNDLSIVNRIETGTCLQRVPAQHAFVTRDEIIFCVTSTSKK
jgi:hypothetical protein